MTSNRPMPIPRHDFYQTETQLIVAVYVKGLAAEGVKDKVEVSFKSNTVEIAHPSLTAPDTTEHFTLGPLAHAINPSDSSFRVLSTKLELKLAKASPSQWSTLTTPLPGPAAANASSSATPATPTGDALPDVGIAGPSRAVGGPGKIQAGVENAKQNQRKNWDKVLAGELDDKEDSSDPNAGGDAAINKLFSSIYADADEDTKRAMIKSFTESGGTTLSTDWSKIGKEKTPTRPPDGMEAKKY